MSAEKMREEFEAWVWNKYRDVFWYDIDREHVLKPCKDGYQTEFLSVRWESWQASRAAIEVDLSELENLDSCDANEVCKLAIESLGLKVKL